MKKIILLCVAIAVLAAIILGVSLIVKPTGMPSGQMDIRQHQYERVYAKDGSVRLSENTSGEGAEVSPAYFTEESAQNFDEIFVWNEEMELRLWSEESVCGAIDRMVTVENTSLLSSAYVRTLVAFEVDYDAVICNVNTESWTWTAIAEGVLLGDGETEGIYDIYEAVYQGNEGKLKAGEESPPSLMQIAFKGGYSSNELLEKVEGRYNILTFSQACQCLGMGDDPEAALNSVFGTLTEQDGEYFAGLGWQ